MERFRQTWIEKVATEASENAYSTDILAVYHHKDEKMTMILFDHCHLEKLVLGALYPRYIPRQCFTGASG